jgi:hypothetical protein
LTKSGKTQTVTDEEDDLRELKAKRWSQRANGTEEWAYEYVVKEDEALSGA